MKIFTQFAQTLNAGELGIPTTSADDLLRNGLFTAYFIAGAIAVVAIIIAGFSMVTGGSDPGTVTKAKNTILYSIIGLVVIIFAAVITQFVTGRF